MIERAQIAEINLTEHYAYRNPTPDSDVDLLIISKELPHTSFTV